MESKSFFGEKGISSTRANQVSELADRYADRAKSVASSLKFYSEELIIPGNKPIIIALGSTEESFKQAIYALDDIIACNSLIAFLREAIKEKARLTKEAREKTKSEQHAEIEQKKKALVRPCMPEPITEEDVMATWSIGEMQKYLSLQAECAVIGKYIHKNGELDVARKELLKKQKCPRVVNGEGHDITITEFTPCLEFEKVDAVYNSLQARWREKQGELNGFKKKIEDAIERDSREKLDKYRNELDKYNSERRMLEEEEARLNCIEQTERNEMLDNIRELKIVIPNNLQNIYNKVINL